MIRTKTRPPAADRLASTAHRGRHQVSALAIAFFLGFFCTAPGCSVIRLAKRTVFYEPREYDVTREEAKACEQYKSWADEVWSEHQGQNPDAPASADYYHGFRNGFVDYCFAGGTGEPPSIPPRRYWQTKYRNESGDQALADWSAGFRAGAIAARVGGYRQRAVVPPPSRQWSARTMVSADDPSAWQTDQLILDGPTDVLNGLHDASELLDAGPELVAPDSKTPATETGPTDGAAPKSDSDPYLRSPIENEKESASEASQPKTSAARLRVLNTPIDETPLDQVVPEIESNRTRFDHFFRVHDDDDVGGDPATGVVPSPSAQQAINGMPTASDEKMDEPAVQAAGPTPILNSARGVNEQSKPTRTSDNTAKRPSKNATELAKRALSLFQDSDDIEPGYTAYGHLFTKQP